MGNKIEFRCGLIDFQVGRDHGKLDFNPSKYIRACSDSNMKRVIFTCKDAYGDAYYKTELVELNPMAGGDYLQEAIDESKKRGIELYAYYNILLDDIYADEHPGHRMVNNKNEKVIAYDYYKSLCPNSPYMDVIRERIADIVFNYDIEGIFFDITYFKADRCFCRFCKEKFQETYGYELKNDIMPGTREYAEFNEFKRLSRAELLITLTETVKEIKTIPVIWNGSGSIYLAEPGTDAFSDYLTTEFHAPDYLDGIIRAKWMQSRGKGFIMTTPSELGSWGDWTMIPKNTLKSVVCSVAAHGGGVFFNHTPYPSGEFAESSIKCLTENIGSSFNYVEGFEEYVRDTGSAADTAVVFSLESKRFYENGFNGCSQADYTASLKGITKIMLESGIPFDVVDEKTLAENKYNYKTLILPAASCISDDFEIFIRNFVKTGGNLISAGDTGFFDEYGRLLENGGISDVLGIRFKGYSDISIEYIVDINESIGRGIPEMPVLVKHGGRLINMDLASDAVQVASKCSPPFEASANRHVYHQHAHPYKRSGYPSIIDNKFEKGRCIHFSADVFRSFYKTASPWIKRLVLNCLAEIHPEPIIKISAPPCIYPTLLKKGDSFILQLLNISGSIIEPVKSFPENMLPVKEIFVKTAVSASRVYSINEDTVIDIKRENGLTGFSIRDIGVHTAVILEKQRG